MIQIIDWDKHYENNRTRELKKMAWVPMPNRQDGDGYTQLLNHVNGSAHFGAWCALIEVASRCDVRGTLLRGGGKPHDFESLARMTRIPMQVWEEVIPRLVSIGWIRLCEIPQEGAGLSQEGAPESQEGDYGTERKERKERNGKKENSLSGSETDPDPVNHLLEQQKHEIDPTLYAQILDCLNANAGTQYNPRNTATRGFIRARWNEGYRFQDFQRVIESKCAQWKRDPKMVGYLRPQTLFGTKFEAYLNESTTGAFSIPCAECGIRGGNHKFDCSKSITSREEVKNSPERTPEKESPAGLDAFPEGEG